MQLLNQFTKCFTQVCYVIDFADYTVYEYIKHKIIMLCFSNEML